MHTVWLSSQAASIFISSTPFSAAEGVPIDVLLCLHGVLSRADIPNHAPEHIREIVRYKLGALHKVAAIVAHVPMNAQRARQALFGCEKPQALRIVGALPIITHHQIYPRI